MARPGRSGRGVVRGLRACSSERKSRVRTMTERALVPAPREGHAGGRGDDAPVRGAPVHLASGGLPRRRGAAGARHHQEPRGAHVPVRALPRPGPCCVDSATTRPASNGGPAKWSLVFHRDGRPIRVFWNAGCKRAHAQRHSKGQTANCLSGTGRSSSCARMCSSASRTTCAGLQCGTSSALACPAQSP